MNTQVDIVFTFSNFPYSINPEKSETHEYVSYGFGECGDDSFIQSVETTRRISLSTQLPSGDMYCVDSS